MIAQSLAEQVEQEYISTQTVFELIEGGLNLVLPNSDTHDRYRDIESVGFSAVIARNTIRPDFYNPLDPTVLDRVSFISENRFVHPQAWFPLEGDPDTLGGQVPVYMGRFTAFALAKINALTTNRFEWSSYRPDRINVAPGQVGFAGGQRLQDSLLAVSGLWEIHDHVVGRLFAKEIPVEAELAKSGDFRTYDEFAEKLETLFEGVKALHSGVEAASLDRSELGELLIAADGLTTAILDQRD